MESFVFVQITLSWIGMEWLHLLKAQNSDADYIGFRINNTPSIKTHLVLRNLLKLSVLKQVAASTEKEHLHMNTRDCSMFILIKNINVSGLNA